MEVMNNLKIQDGDRPPYSIFVFAIHKLNCRKSNTEDNLSNLVILAAIE